MTGTHREAAEIEAAFAAVSKAGGAVQIQKRDEVRAQHLSVISRLKSLQARAVTFLEVRRLSSSISETAVLETFPL